MRVLEAVSQHGCLYVLFMQGHMLCEGFRVKYGEQAGLDIQCKGKDSCAITHREQGQMTGLPVKQSVF